MVILWEDTFGPYALSAGFLDCWCLGSETFILDSPFAIPNICSKAPLFFIVDDVHVKKKWHRNAPFTTCIPPLLSLVEEVCFRYGKCWHLIFIKSNFKQTFNQFYKSMTIHIFTNILTCPSSLSHLGLLIFLKYFARMYHELSFVITQCFIFCKHDDSQLCQKFHYHLTCP